MARARRKYTGETAKCGECGQRVRVYTHSERRWLEPHKRLALDLSQMKMVNAKCRYSDCETSA